jgi:hypothetical protein
VGAARGLDEVRLDYLFLDASFFPDASRLADRVGGTGPGAAEVLARLGDPAGVLDHLPATLGLRGC